MTCKEWFACMMYPLNYFYYIGTQPLVGDDIYDKLFNRLEKIDKEGYFILTNPLSGKVLTAKAKDHLMIESK